MFELKNIDTGKFTSVQAIENFTTKRLLIGQFNSAEKTLKEGIEEIGKHKIFYPSAIVVIQPMRKYEGGLSQVEERVLIEVALSAGARKAIVWVGDTLTDQEVAEHAKGV